MGRWQSVDGEGLEETLCLVGLVIGEDGEELLEPLESEVAWRELSGSGEAVEGGGGGEEVVPGGGGWAAGVVRWEAAAAARRGWRRSW